MKAAGISEIKKELHSLPAVQLAELCLRLARFKKENKELLTYLLFEAADPDSYVHNAKLEITESFSTVNKSNLYLAKKSVRKILRQTNKYIKYTGLKQVEVELLLHFCTTLKNSGIPLRQSTALNNLYHNQLKKITAALHTLHEDLQYDYTTRLEALQ